MNNNPQPTTSEHHHTKEAPSSSSPSTFKKMVQSVKRITARHAKSDVERAYKFGQELGTGNFAVVRLAEHRGTKQRYACKIINKALCAGKEDMIETEISVLKKVKHKYIVGMHECFDTPDKLYLVLDYVSGGELFDRIVDEGNFTEADASRITKQMTEAIQYLHEHGIVHRDLKPENLLFRDRSPQSDILVTDFGLAKLLNDNVVLKTACGTPNYVAPEILMQRGYGKQVDVWSLGVILFILLCGYPPFYDESDAVLFELIMKGKFDFDERYWRDISKEAKHLISNMLVVDPVKRYDTYQVLEHPWITGKASIPTVNLSKSISMNLKKAGLGQSRNNEEDFNVTPPSAPSASSRAAPAASSSSSSSATAARGNTSHSSSTTSSPSSSSAATSRSKAPSSHPRARGTAPTAHTPSAAPSRRQRPTAAHHHNHHHHQQHQQHHHQHPHQHPTHHARQPQSSSASTATPGSSSSSSSSSAHHRSSPSSSMEARRRAAARQRAEKMATNLSKVPETRKTVV